MFGIFDFKDTLTDLFLEVGGRSSADLQVLEGQKLGVDELQFLTQFTKQLFRDDVFVSLFQDFVRSFHGKMTACGVDFVMVSAGGFYSNEVRSLELNHAVNRTFWKSFFYQELHRRLENPRQRQLKAQEHVGVMRMMYQDGVTHGSMARYYGLFRSNLYNELGLDFIRAPKNAENQLLWMYQQGSISAVMSTPIAFLFAGIDQVIDELDFPEGRFWFFDFQKIAEALGLTSDKLRVGLILLLASYLDRLDNGSNMKLVQAVRQTHSSMPKSYAEERVRHVREAREFLEGFRTRTAGVEREEEWAAVGLEILGVPKKCLERVRNELFKAQVITEKVDFVSFPAKKPLSAKRFCFGVHMKDLLVLYCMDLFSDPLLFLLSENFDNTWFFPVTFIYSLQTLQMRIVYFREAIERALFRVLSLRGAQEAGRYTFVPSHDLNFKVTLRTDFFYSADYPDLSADAFKVTGAGFPTADPLERARSEGARRVSLAEFAGEELWMPSFPTADNPLSVRNSLQLMVQEVDRGRRMVAVPDTYSFSAMEVSGLLNLKVLEDLGYLDLRRGWVSNLGRVMLECVSPELFEASVVALELARIDMFDMKQEDQLLAQLQSLSRENQEAAGKGAFNLPEAQRQRLASRASFQELMQHTIKINLLESQVSIIDHEVTEFLLSAERFPEDRAVFAKVAESVKERRRQLDFISKFFMLTVPNVKVRGLADYECTLFFEKMITVLMGLDITTKSSLAHLFLKTGARTPLATLTRALRRIPYIQLPSNEMGMLAKKVATNFLLFSGLSEHGLRFAKEYARVLQSEAIEKSFGLPLPFPPIVAKTFRFFSDFERVSKCLGPWGEETPASRFRKAFAESRGLFEGLHKYFGSLGRP